MAEIAPPRGTHDILPAEQTAWRWALDTHRRVAESFGYAAIETPVFEHTELFSRGVGDATDVVEKQMFTFEDRGGRSLTLRPEGTAGTVRAVLGHRLEQESRPVRVHYAGQFFRAERPAAGKQRQFNQVGVECIGERTPHLDVEVIEVGWRFYTALGIGGLDLQVNSLGTSDDRRTYERALVAYYEPHEHELCDDCRRRLRTNPLRLLDCKRDAALAAAAPPIWDSLAVESRRFFTAVLAGLEAARIPLTHNPHLVRGLDYYTHTTFEYWHPTLHGAQNALGGGGRYDGLAGLLGFAETPGIGYALGVERLLMVAGTLGVVPPAGGACDVVVCSVADAEAEDAAGVARQLRDAGVRVVLDAGERRLDRKLTGAVKQGARAAVIVGEDEARDSTATVRDLVRRSQDTVSRSALAETIARLLDAPS